MKNEVLCSRKGQEFGEWQDDHTASLSHGSGTVRLEIHRNDALRDDDPCVILMTREEAGRLGLFLVAAAMKEGWEP